MCKKNITHSKDTKKCIYCGDEFTPANGNQVYCSTLCKSRQRGFKRRGIRTGEKHNKVCRHCGKEYTAKNAKSFTCSKKCLSAYYRSIGLYVREKSNALSRVFLKYCKECGKPFFSGSPTSKRCQSCGHDHAIKLKKDCAKRRYWKDVEKSREIERERHKKMYYRNRDYEIERARKNKINLKNHYVAYLLGMKASDAPKELIEVKRLYVQIKRQLNEVSV